MCGECKSGWGLLTLVGGTWRQRRSDACGLVLWLVCLGERAARRLALVSKKGLWSPPEALVVGWAWVSGHSDRLAFLTSGFVSAPCCVLSEGLRFLGLGDG